MGHVLQSSLVPRRTILLKAGTEAISELEVTKCTAVCYLFCSVLCLISDGWGTISSLLLLKDQGECATLTLSVYLYFTCIKVWVNQDAWLGAWQGCGSHTWPDGPWSYQQKVGAYAEVCLCFGGCSLPLSLSLSPPERTCVFDHKPHHSWQLNPKYWTMRYSVNLRLVSPCYNHCVTASGQFQSCR